MGSANKALATLIPKGIQQDTFYANTDRAQDGGVGSAVHHRQPWSPASIQPVTEEMSDVFWKAGHEKPR